MKKVTVFLVAIFLFAGLTSVQATPLPWLDFGSHYSWDGADTFTDDGSSYVKGLTYMDGTYVPPPFYPLPDIFGESVTFSISYDGVSNDWIKIGGGTYFSAELDVTGTADVPMQNNYALIKSNNLFIGTGIGSRWANELASVLNLTSSNPAMLALSWTGSTLNPDGTHTVNGSGKISPVPEPGTLLLFGSGIAGLLYVRRTKTFNI